MAGAFIFGGYRAVELYFSNTFLFSICAVSALIGLCGAFFQFSSDEGLELMWMRWYLLPMVMLVFGVFLLPQEATNSLAQSLGRGPVYFSPIGKSSDYFSAMENNFIAMLFPASAWFCAWVVQQVLDVVKRMR